MPNVLQLYYCIFRCIFDDTESTGRYFLNKRKDEESICAVFIYILHIRIYTYSAIAGYYTFSLAADVQEFSAVFFSAFSARACAQVHQSFYDPWGKCEWWRTVVTRRRWRWLCAFKRWRVRAVSRFPFPSTVSSPQQQYGGWRVRLLP